MSSSPRPAPAGLFARVAGGLRYAMTGAAPPAWFGPSAPLTPEAPPETAGRQFDYPVGFNLRLQPRQDEGTSFAELRGLADAYDLVRLVIETRKDQIEAMDWQVRARRGGGLVNDPRIAAIEDLLRSPDREHPWSAWVRLLLEDLFVLDAPTLYVRRTATGALWGLEVIDGATVKRLLGPDGRTPRAPDPAYQQVLKGVPAVDYTTDELIYAPRNPRPHKVYGYSPVEQILMTVNIGLRRQVSQLNYFTEGNTPEALIGVPEQWTPDQIRQFQEYWDALLEGNLAARRHTRFVPGGLKYQPIRDVPLKDEFDEWLARVVCFAFSIPPTAFAKETNRATAETALGTAIAEGLQPLLVWLKGLIDRVIGQVLGCDDLEFAWADRSVPDPEVQATIAAAYVGAGIKTRNEVRAELGLDPIAGGDALTTAGPAAPLPGGLAKFNSNWPTQPRDAGQWATDASSRPASAPPRATPSVGAERSDVAADKSATPSPAQGGPLTGEPMIDVDAMGNPLYPSAPALAAGGLAVGGAAAVLGGAAAVDALLPIAAGTASETVTIADVAAALPEGMTPVHFGRLAGFSQGLTNSSAAATTATPEVVANLQAAGVTRNAVSLFQRFYAGAAANNPANLSAIHRAALLSNILKGY